MSRVKGATPAGHAAVYLAGLLTLAEIGLAAAIEGRPFPALRYLAPVFGAAALLLIFSSLFALRRHGDVAAGGSYMEATRVVDRGPYAAVRHPQYLGYMSLNVTFVLVAQYWLVLLLAVAAIALFARQARREEARLLAEFGRAYADYMRRVPAFNLVLGVARAARRGRR